MQTYFIDSFEAWHMVSLLLSLRDLTLDIARGQVAASRGDGFEFRHSGKLQAGQSKENTGGQPKKLRQGTT